ncbi:hypothetical protein WDV94_16350 [Clavibacter tessellarius]
MSALAARARRRPSTSSTVTVDSGPMPTPCGFSPESARRLAWRTTSWFDSTQVLGAPTDPKVASDASIVRRSAVASHGVSR